MDVFILISGLITISIVLYLTRNAFKTERTILGYFWGDKSIKSDVGGHLLWSSSLSLNGLFYHAWLGYSVGIYSLVIQLIWVLGFVLLIPFITKGKLFNLVKSDTLHGNIGHNFGRKAQIISAFASVVTFVTLSAWEISVLEGFISSEMKEANDFKLSIPYLVLFVALLYTLRGGLIINSKVNAFFGKLTFVILSITAVVVLFNTDLSVFFSFSTFKFNPLIIGLTIGWLAFVSNAVFSLLWQVSEMSTWQSLTAVSNENVLGVKRALYAGILRILFAPGLIGTIFGMALAHKNSINESNILGEILNSISYLPTTLSVSLIIFVLIVFFASSLSTLDGQLLASSKAFVFDILKRKDARKYLLNSARALNTQNIETKNLFKLSDLIMILVSIIIGLMAYLFHIQQLSLFDMVYIAVCGQMSLVVATFFMMMGKESLYNATLGIASGLIAGVAVILLKLFNIDPILGIGSWLNIVPIVTILFSLLGVRLVR